MRKILYKAGVLFSIVLVIWPFSGCTKKQSKIFTGDTGSSPESTSQSVSKRSMQVETIADSVELPLENTEYKTAQMKNYETIGAQFFLDEKRYYQIANAIYHYRDYHNTLIFDQDFMDIQQADPALLVEIAVSQAPHIDQYSNAYRNLTDDSPIGNWVLKKKDSGFPIGLIAYGDVVRAEANVLFGETYELPRTNGRTIQYDKELDLYYLNRESASLATDYPIITEELDFPEKEKTIAVKAITLCYWEFNGVWAAPDGSWESNGMSMSEIKNYVKKQMQSDSKQFIPSTYYLQESDGILRVIGYQKG